jgi:actin related protein 2/3 complex subunit 5
MAASTSASSLNYRTINIDALDPESAYNFDISSLTPSISPTSAAEVQSTAGQIRQLLRGGDSEGALRGALDTAPYGADDKGKVSSLRSVIIGKLGGYPVMA